MPIRLSCEPDDLRALVRSGRRKCRARSPVLRMTQGAFHSVVAGLMLYEPERGGMLLGPEGEDLVTEFVFDERGRGTPSMFEFDERWLNQVLRERLQGGVECKGMAHSHPSGCRQLSAGDLVYVRKLFACATDDTAEVYMPIVVDGRVCPFVCRRSSIDRPVEAQLILV